MPFFYYEAIDPKGNAVHGSHEAEIIQQVEEWLQAQQLTPTAITATGEGMTGEADQQRITLWQKWQGVSLDDLTLFCRQSATLLDAGVDLMRGLTILTGQIRNPILSQTVARIRDDIEQGESLSEAYTKYPAIFSLLFRNIIKVGEESGTLDKAFAYMADLLENEKEVRERIKAATRYPKIVITALLGAVFFLMSFVVPKFVLMFASAHVQLPLATRILIAISNFFANNVLLIIVGIVALVVFYRMAMEYEQCVRLRDSLLLRLPIFGSLYTKLFMARFARVFAVLTSSGIDIIKTLELSSAALDNIILRDHFAQITAQVREGVSLDEALERRGFLPPMVTQMVTIGVESGTMETMMNKVADYYDQESDYTIRHLSTLIEPILLLCMGIMVGFIALAIFTPMWSMMEVARGGMR